MNYYTTLNVPPTASDDEIKKAYRTLAKQHHPDAGGNEAKFKEITEAYTILSNPNKRRMVDIGQDPNNTPNDFNFHSGNFGDLRDIFSHFGGFHQRPQQRNKSVVSRISLTLEEVLSGKCIDAEIALPGNNKKIVNISIPAGVESGQQVKFAEMGDASIASLRPGDLIVHINVIPHQQFERSGPQLIFQYTMPVWDAILGTTITVHTLDKQTLNIKIPPGTQSGKVFNCKGHGLPILQQQMRGDLFVKLSIDIPTTVTTKQTDMINKLKESFLTPDNEDIT